MSTPRNGGEPPQNIAAAVADISERASILVREEIELAKAELTEKTTKIAKGAAVGAIAGIFFVWAVLFLLIGLAWLLVLLPARQSVHLLLGLLRGRADPDRARRRGGADRGARPETRRAAGADDGDRRGAEDPRDRGPDARRAVRGGAQVAASACRPRRHRCPLRRRRQRLRPPRRLRCRPRTGRAG